jgi:cobalt/nickel transport system permease protein
LPQGLDRINRAWPAPMPGYQTPLAANPMVGYLLSAFVGIGAISLLAWIGLRPIRLRSASHAMHPTRGKGRIHLPGFLHPHQRSAGLEKTWLDFQHGLAEAWVSESYVDRPGLFQQLDPRMKVIIALFFLIAIGLSRSLATLAGLSVLTLGLAWASRIPPARLIRRVWPAPPFFTAGLVLPALVMTPGPALIHLPAHLAITQSGVRSALFLRLRVSSSLSLTSLLILTTRWNSLLRAMAALKIPVGLIWIPELTYRYSFTLLEQAGEMLLSRKSRVLGRLPAGVERKVLAASAGVLWGKTLDLGSEVSLGMRARGLREVPRTMDRFKTRRPDWVVGLVMLLVLACSIWLGNGLPI